MTAGRTKPPARKMGRPPLPAEVKRSARMEIRMSEAEHAAILEAAGDRDASAWVREAALAKAKRAGRK